MTGWPAWREKLKTWHAADQAKKTAALRRERRRVSEARLYEGRTTFGRVELFFVPYVHTRRAPKSPSGKQQQSRYPIRGQAFRVTVPEPIDAWELLRDMYRFNKAWRPMRLRTDAHQAATREWFEQWERLGAVVEPGRWA